METTNQVRKEAVSYELIRGRLYFIGKDGYKLEVPESMRDVILTDNHDGRMAAHGGVHATYQRMKKAFHWPGMWKDVLAYVRSCHKCQTNKVGPSTHIRTGAVGQGAEHPFHTVSLDIKGPLPTTAKGSRYIISWIDVATRYVEASASATKDAEAVVESLSALIARHGVPRRIISDRDMAFLGKVMQLACKRLAIEHDDNPAYAKWMNGIVERFHGSIGTSLSHFVNEEDWQWDEQLPYALYAYRTAYQEKIQSSPFELVYGRAPRSLSEAVMDVTGSSSADGMTVDERLAKAMRRREEREKEPTIATQAAVYKVGDEVMLKKTEGRSGLEPRWTGPFKVVSDRKDRVTYLGWAGKELHAHKNHVFLYNPRIHKPDSEEFTAQDLENVLVNGGTVGTGKGKRKGSK